MLPLATTGGGKALAVPDVCLTPPIATPTPYPNLADCADGDGARSVSVQGSAVLRVGDRIRRTTGDEAGNMPGGAVSGRFAAEAEFAATPQVAVRVEGKLAAVQGASTIHNAGNAVGLHAVPSQRASFVMPSAPGGGNPADDVEDLLDCSPTLRAQLEEFRERGWEVGYGPTEEGTRLFHSGPYHGNALPDSMRIQIAEVLRTFPSLVAGSLAHELGHARDGFPRVLSEPGMSRRDFVETNTNLSLLSEGHAVFNELTVAEEMARNPAERCQEAALTIARSLDRDYHEIFESALTDDQKRVRLGARAAAEHPSGTPPGTTTRQYYRDMMGRIWDQNFAS